MTEIFIFQFQPHSSFAEMITWSSHLMSSFLSSRSLPGSALELRYSHGGGSLPAGSTTHLDPFGGASTGGVVRRSHRARWSSAREDSTKVRKPVRSPSACVWFQPNMTQHTSQLMSSALFWVASIPTGRAGLCWGAGTIRAALTTRTTGNLASAPSCCPPVDRRMCRPWPSCCRNSWRPSIRRSSKEGNTCDATTQPRNSTQVNSCL